MLQLTWPSVAALLRDHAAEHQSLCRPTIASAQSRWRGAPGVPAGASSRERTGLRARGPDAGGRREVPPLYRRIETMDTIGPPSARAGFSPKILRPNPARHVRPHEWIAARAGAAWAGTRSLAARGDHDVWANRAVRPKLSHAALVLAMLPVDLSPRWHLRAGVDQLAR
jgi:hypothetical protein